MNDFYILLVKEENEQKKNNLNIEESYFCRKTKKEKRARENRIQFSSIVLVGSNG